MAFTKRPFSQFPSSSSTPIFTLGRKTIKGLGDFTDFADYTDAGMVPLIAPDGGPAYSDGGSGVVYQDANGNWITDSSAPTIQAVQSTPNPTNTAATIQQMMQSSPNPAQTSQAVQQAIAQTPAGSDWLSTLKTLIPTITQSLDQQKLFSVNLDRARAGLPPINAAAYTPGFNFGLTSNTQKLVEYGLIGLAGLWVFSSLVKRRRA